MSINSPDTQADAEQVHSLVERLKSGDVSALEPLMRRYNGWVFRVARSVLSSHADAEDCAQVVWVKVFRQISTFEGHASVGSWIGRIAYNEAVDIKRTERGGRAPVEEAMAQPTMDPDPEQVAIRAETLSRLEQAIAQLAAPLREAFMLRDVAGAQAADVALALGITAENVRVRSHRARAQLSHELKDHRSHDAFSFDGERCNRIVRRVHASLGLSMP